MHRRTLSIVGLELYAVLLALLQSLGGVRTDEAKYLLNIPYPHPPLARWVMGLTEVLPFQEMLWRIILASLLVQAVWLVWDLGRELPVRSRMALAVLWLLSGAFVLQAGSIMMAPLTALQGLVFVWLLRRPKLCENNAGWIALFWLASLFTAYQAALFLPVVAVLFWRMRRPLWQRISFIVVPLVLVALYTLTNPLAVASFMSAGGQNAGMTLLTSLQSALHLWLIGGSVLLSILGVLGMVRTKQWPLILSFLLIVAFVVVSYRPYYAILFLPLLIAGVASAPSLLRMPVVTAGIATTVTVLVLIMNPPDVTPGPARSVMQSLDVQDGIILIAGPFGHEWQYESSVPVLRYRPALLSEASAIICLQACADLPQQGWSRFEEASVDVWVRF